MWEYSYGHSDGKGGNFQEELKKGLAANTCFVESHNGNFRGYLTLGDLLDLLSEKGMVGEVRTRALL